MIKKMTQSCRIPQKKQSSFIFLHSSTIIEVVVIQSFSFCRGIVSWLGCSPQNGGMTDGHSSSKVVTPISPFESMEVNDGRRPVVEVEVSCDEDPCEKTSTTAPVSPFHDLQEHNLTSRSVKEEIAELEKLIAQDQKVARRAEEQRKEAEALRLQVSMQEKDQYVNAFFAQDTFRWNIPPGAAAVIHPRIENGERVRPDASGMTAPPLPPLPAVTLPFTEQETVHAERYKALQVRREIQTRRRRAMEFDMEESLFNVPSSDDSEGYDEDFEAEWKASTSDVYRVCKAVQHDFCDDGAVTDFVSYLRTVEDAPLTPTEVSLIWDTVRYCYRAAEPLHPKHWLGSCHEILRTGNFVHRPSVTTFVCVLRAAQRITSLSERQKKKIERWLYRAIFLVRKRVCVLQEFGVDEPTWKQVNASCSGLSRDAKVPTFTLNDALTALTEASEQIQVDNSSMARDLCSLHDKYGEDEYAFLRRPTNTDVEGGSDNS